ncbi:mitochondrial inner membrane protein OXA1-like isoform X2 [Triticum aestivum]|uniref:mitochondrial inner membrane protein OXA1-like isoform X2 n=1 Tax=Triticum aestivum TaxID=4565 RepID=UPI001D005E4D|nr:mitochondrial inner membrane protein OXA1-like isoform X2 [Triticum aestivum]
MAFAAAARRSLASPRISDCLSRRFHPALPQLLPSNSIGDPRKPSPLPLPPAPRPLRFSFSPCGTAQTLDLLPFGIHLLAGPPRRGFSSSSRDIDFADVLTGAANAWPPVAAPASFPGEVALAAGDSSIAVAAVQHLIDAVHSFTGGFPLLYPQCSYGLCRAHCGCLPGNEYMLGLASYLPLIVTPYTLITLHIAVSNMVDNVPSLKGGGAFWFTDLTTPDALCIFPMITSLFIMLTSELKYSASKKCEKCSRTMHKEAREALRVISLLSMLLTATLPQAISCSLVTWSSLSLAERIALEQPAVQKVLYGTPLKQRRCSCDGQKGPTAEDTPSVKEQEEPVSPETKKSCDGSTHRDETDKKSTKGG